MRIAPLTAFIVLAAGSLTSASQFQRGAVSSVTVEPGANDAAVVLTVRGSNPCRAVSVDYGDGIVDTPTITSLPATLNHQYASSGTFRVVVRGVTNCAGVASATVRATVATGGGVRGNTRFPNMDRNNDGVITRQEWRGSDQSFRTHDWNNDGVLSGDEIRAGARRRDQQDFGEESMFNDWTVRGFVTLDRDGNNRITSQEWPYDRDTFMRVDRNGDNILTRPEFLAAADDTAGSSRFDQLDTNGNGRIERYEWRGTRDAFDYLDRNNDGVLTRTEIANDLDTVDPSANTVTIRVPGDQRWTDTGLMVRVGDVLSFDATGTVYMTTGTDDAASPQGSHTGRRAAGAALPTRLAGALVARVDNSTPFMIGERTGAIRMPRDGRLYLGVNDDYFGDNRGEFRVTITSVVR